MGRPALDADDTAAEGDARGHGGRGRGHQFFLTEPAVAFTYDRGGPLQALEGCFAEGQDGRLVTLDLQDEVAAEGVYLGGGRGRAVSSVARHDSPIEAGQGFQRGAGDKGLLPFFFIGAEQTVRP